MKRAFLIPLLFLAYVSASPIRLFGSGTINSIQSEGARLNVSPVTEERGVVALDQALRELTNPFTVMCIAAHPDDVDYGTLAYYHKKLGARAVTVLATRGEAGHEAIDQPLYENSGVGRTREALEAARIIGSDVYFLNLPDFGFSKSAEEALNVWGYDEALLRLVRAIRLLRPDVIITGHDPKQGTGQHQAVGRLIFDAAEAAADAKRFPEAGSETWRVRRIFQKVQQSDASVIVNLTEYDHVRGRNYAQIGFAALQRVSSQNSLPAQATPDIEKSFYKFIRSPLEEALQPGATFLDGLALPENLSRSIAPPRVNDSALTEIIGQRERLIEVLKEKLIEKRAEGTPDQLHERYAEEFFRVVRFTEALERALTLALGVEFRAAIADPILVPGQRFTLKLMARNGSNRILPLVFHVPENLPMGDKARSYQTSEVVALASGEVASKEYQYQLSNEVASTLPHSAHVYEENYYPIGSTPPGSQTPEPFGHRILALAEVSLDQISFAVPALIRFDVTSPVEISVIPPFALVKDWATRRDMEFTARVRNRTQGELNGALWVVPLALNEDNYEPAHISFVREDEEVTIRLKLKVPILKPPLSPDVLIEFRREKPAPPDPLGTAKIIINPVNFDVAQNIKVGYVRGYDNWLALALTQLGVDHGELSPDEISVTDHGNSDQLAAQPDHGCGDLSRFDTIIIDSLAYSARPELMRHNQCLLSYVRQGGNLIVLYQRAEDWNSTTERGQLAPFPIKLSAARISIESAPVKILDPENTILLKPNKIAQGDFENWRQERALYLPVEWAAEYTALLESGDPVEEPQKGGMLVARYGEGTYIYTSYTLRRQLLSLNSGAYRLMANMISLPKTSKEQPAK